MQGMRRKYRSRSTVAGPALHERVQSRREGVRQHVHTLPLIDQLLLLGYLLAELGSLSLPSLLVLLCFLYVCLLHLGPSSLPGSLCFQLCPGRSACLRAGVAALAGALI